MHADETIWPERGKRAWLWIAAAPLVVTFLIHAKRSAVAARALLGTFAGILVTDRWSAYEGWSLKTRQLCRAHLLRDCNFIAESSGTAALIGNALVHQTRQFFKQWYRVRDGTMTRALDPTRPHAVWAERLPWANWRCSRSTRRAAPRSS